MGLTMPLISAVSSSAVIRPENIVIAPREAGQTDGWIGVVSFVKPLGSTVEYEVEVDGRAPVRVMALRGAKERTLAVGETVVLNLRDPEACVILEGRGP